MKKTGRVMICCVALLLVLTSVSAVQRHLDSSDDLKKINFGQSVPKHSLLLLYWFANAVDINMDGDITLTYDPESRAYGSHRYHNSEGMLDRLPQGNEYRYYTVGSLNQGTSMSLPTYVVRPPATEYVGSNRDRIIIRIRGPSIGWQVLQRIDQVYITQHIEHRGEYDPDHTYRITTNLLRQIRHFSVGENQQQLLQLRNHFRSNADDFQLRHIRNTWGANLAGLGLLLYIVIQEKYSSNQRNDNHEKRQKHRDDDASESNVSRNLPNQDYVVNVDEDLEANRMTGNRESGNCSVAQTMMKFCCLVICFIIILCLIFVMYRR